MIDGVVMPYVCAQTGAFKHLGSTLSLDGRSQISLRARLACGWKAFFSRMEVWKASAPLNSKLQVLHQVVQACVLYGAESWTLTSAQLRSLDVIFNAMIRRILNLRRRPLEVEALSLGLTGGAEQTELLVKHGWMRSSCHGQVCVDK